MGEHSQNLPVKGTGMKRLLLSIVSIGLMIGLIQPARTLAASVVADVDYTRDGNPDSGTESAIQASLMFFLSRLPHGKPQTITEYLRSCKPEDIRSFPNEACPRPDFSIQLDVDERQGEVEISGSVTRKVGKSSSLDLVRVKPRDLPFGLSHAMRSIDAIITAASPRPRRVRAPRR